MLKKVLITLLCATFACQSFAKAPQPPRCPSASSIKSAGVPELMYDQYSDAYAAVQVSQYDTDFTWGFGISDIKASSQEEALRIGAEQLAGLAGSPAPAYEERFDVWMCYYATTTGDMAVAVTPFRSLPQLTKKISEINH